jgi:hypothetical protein
LMTVSNDPNFADHHLAGVDPRWRCGTPCEGRSRS